MFCGHIAELAAGFGFAAAGCGEFKFSRGRRSGGVGGLYTL